MKHTYLLLAMLGFIAPNILVTMVSVETGNILLWLHPMETISNMFANKIASAFVIDLLFVVIVFMLWSFQEARKYKIKNIGFIWLLAFLFGLAGTLPLFLYLKEKKVQN
ncbi:MAG: DUF2834 domain-containing protein [Flavipsychrobacter sp.]